MLRRIRIEELGGFQGQILGVAQTAASMSEDPGTKVGFAVAQLTGDVWAGYNQFIGLDDPASATREERYAAVVHAEVSAFLSCGSLSKGGLFVGTHEPCRECWKVLAYQGPGQVIFLQTDQERRERWGCQEGREMFTRALPDVEILEVVS